MPPETTLTVAILELLEQHGSLAYDEVAARVDERPDAVRDALARLRGVGFVDSVTVGDLEAHLSQPATYWRLTEAGRAELARRRFG
jgi:predicted ArsR family transcriptional regulator